MERTCDGGWHRCTASFADRVPNRLLRLIVEKLSGVSSCGSELLEQFATKQHAGQSRRRLRKNERRLRILIRVFDDLIDECRIDQARGWIDEHYCLGR